MCVRGTDSIASPECDAAATALHIEQVGLPSRNRSGTRAKERRSGSGGCRVNLAGALSTSALQLLPQAVCVKSAEARVHSR